MKIYVDNVAEAELLISSLELMKLQSTDACTAMVCDKLINRISKCIDLQYGGSNDRTNS